MAERTDLSDDELGLIASIVDSQNMAKIATDMLGLSTETLSQDEKENQWKFNYNILQTWKSAGKEKATRQGLADALKRAAGLVDYSKVEDILGISQEESLEDGRPELTDTMLLNLSELIKSPQQLRVLAIDGLGLEFYFTETILRNSSTIHKAAGYLLTDWLKMQPNGKVAYANLSDALRNVNMEYYIDVALREK